MGCSILFYLLLFSSPVHHNTMVWSVWRVVALNKLAVRACSTCASIQTVIWAASAPENTSYSSKITPRRMSKSLLVTRVMLKLIYPSKTILVATVPTIDFADENIIITYSCIYFVTCLYFRDSEPDEEREFQTSQQTCVNLCFKRTLSSNCY